MRVFYQHLKLPNFVWKHFACFIHFHEIWDILQRPVLFERENKLYFKFFMSKRFISVGLSEKRPFFTSGPKFWKYKLSGPKYWSNEPWRAKNSAILANWILTCKTVFLSKSLKAFSKVSEGQKLPAALYWPPLWSTWTWITLNTVVINIFIRL